MTVVEGALFLGQTFLPSGEKAVIFVEPRRYRKEVAKDSLPVPKGTAKSAVIARGRDVGARSPRPHHGRGDRAPTINRPFMPPQ